MGKTVIALTAADRILYDRFEVSKVLVIAPLRVAEDMAAADILNVRFLHLEDEAEKASPEPAPAPEEEWIKTHENWI